MGRKMKNLRDVLNPFFWYASRQPMVILCLGSACANIDVPQYVLPESLGHAASLLTACHDLFFSSYPLRSDVAELLHLGEISTDISSAINERATYGRLL